MDTGEGAVERRREEGKVNEGGEEGGKEETGLYVLYASSLTQFFFCHICNGKVDISLVYTKSL